MAKQIAGKFGSRERRHIEFFPGRAQFMTRMRRKRFVGKAMCEYMAPSLCKGSKALCKGEFVNEGITNHSTQEDTTPLRIRPRGNAIFCRVLPAIWSPKKKCNGKTILVRLTDELTKKT